MSLYVKWLDLVCRMVPDTRSAILKYTEDGEDVYVSWPTLSKQDKQLLDSLTFAEAKGSLVTLYSGSTLTVVSPVEVSANEVATLALSIHVKAEAVEPIKRLINWAICWLSELMQSSSLNNNQALQEKNHEILQHFLSAPEQQSLLNATAEYLAKRHSLTVCKLVMHSNEHVLSSSYGADLPSLDGLLFGVNKQLLQGLSAGGLHEIDCVPDVAAHLEKHSKANSGSILVVRVHDMQLSIILSFDKVCEENNRATNDIKNILEQCCSFLLVAENIPLNSGRARKNYIELLHKPNIKNLKAYCIAFLVIIAVFLIPVDYNIPVSTIIEGKIQKSIVSPFDGFVKSTTLKAGDVVSEGDVIAELDSQQLTLDVIQVSGLYQEYEKGYRKALANREYGSVNVFQAKLKQAKANIDQIKLKLDKTKITSPISGMIILGDLSRDIGAPVATGDLLFQVAPLNQYRAMLKVKEADIRFIKEGQLGLLKLAALPSSTFDISVLKPSPLFSEENGKIVYLAEAKLPEATLSPLRPGMEGVARINVGSYSLAWVLSHHLIDWLRITVWKLWL